MKILIIEDEKQLQESITSYFQGDGLRCEVASTFQEASEKIALYQYDCILLDLGLPDGDGLRLLQEIKSLKKKEGVLIISARHSLDDKLEGLDMGADDYLVKPFHLSELRARVIAIVRRKKFDGDQQLVFDEILIDFTSMRVLVHGQPVLLTKKEYDLLIYFISNRGKVVTKNAIAEHLWGDDMDLADDYDFIYSHIKNLRKKLTSAGAVEYIHSIYGIGYKFGIL
ncbi:response regulator transcription factor [Pedobacter antarcticus]|uniref:response regulator transcription factor n=1 Tax=Pedobacter antarcticus TaxID=34086 RepID=UPI002930D80F|nr:response regulator transcription factor [Pedobacter antarcticus]